MQSTAKTITLTQAAARAGLRYQAMLDLVLCKRVKGWQEDGRRWRVDSRDLDRFIRDRDESKQAA